MSNSIPVQLLVWYLWENPREIVRGWNNFLRFGLEFFSIPLLFKTFFAPWRGYQWSYGRGFDFGRYFEVSFSNLITRLLGAFMRGCLILIGLVTEFFFLIGGLLALIAWYLSPLIIIKLFLLSIGA